MADDGSITKSKTIKKKRGTQTKTDIQLTGESFSLETISFQTFSTSVSEVKSKVSSSLKDDDSLLLTSTPKYVKSHHTCEEHHDDHSGKGLRKRGKDCHRIHYTCDMDDSNLSQYQGKKNQKKRLTLLESLSIDHSEREELHLDTLENHLFTDISYSKSDLSYESKFRASKDANTSWSKLHGVSYSSKFDFSEDDDDHLSSFHCINHPSRSDFRQKRRIWYLNRRNRGYHVHKEETFWQRFIRNILYLFSFTSIFMYNISQKLNILYYYISKIPTHVFTRFIYRPLHSIFFLCKRKVLSVYTKFCSLFNRGRSSDKTTTIQTVDDKSESAFPWCFCILFWLFIVLVLYINFSHHIITLPNPTERGIANAYPLFIDAKNSKIPAWHVHPVHSTSTSTHPLNKSFDDKNPVIMYLRKSGNADTPDLKTVYETLSSLGYHLIVPINILSQIEASSTWKWIKMQTNSTVYMWGYDINSATLSDYAKRFCKDLIPPTGVIIAKEVKVGILHRNLEIWACNCTLAPNGIPNGTDYKYNHVKCPITFSNNEDVYGQVVSCIETVNKDLK